MLLKDVLKEFIFDLFEYDNQSREISHTQQKSDDTEVITITKKYDKNGNIRFQTDGNNVTTENTYDAINQLLTTSVTVNGVNQTTTYASDKNGNLLSETDWLGNSLIYEYDPLNRLILKKDANQKIIERLEYNNNDVQVKSYDAFDKVTEFTYDKNNRLLSTKDQSGHISSQTYDNVGNIETKTDGNNNTTTYNYDEFNNLISVVNDLNETTSYTYDLNGNMLTQTDGKGNTTTFEYNSINNPIGRYDQSGNGVPAKTETYTYYSNGLLHTKTDRNGEMTSYTYDSHGNQKSITVGDITITNTYDNNGNLLTVTDTTGTTTRTYDELNRVKSKTVSTIGQSTYEYDITTGVDSGFVAETSTDPKNNITTKVYDKARRLKEVRVGSDTTTYSYYDNGSLKNIVYQDGSREDYTYYDDNLLHTLINTDKNGTEIDSYTYTYDAAHNMLTKVDKKGTTSYDYDDLERLSIVTEPSGKVTTYTFDKAGNRATETIVNGTDTTVITYNYNEQNRLLDTETKLNGVIVQTGVYSYDNNGNVLTETLTPYVDGIAQTLEVTTNIFDKLNQLINTTTSNGTIVSNTYNGEGIRVAKSVDGVVINYLYEFDKVVLETDSNNNQKARNVYGTNLVSRTVDNETYYYFYNGHADVVALVDDTGAVAKTYYYDAFGNIVEETGNVDNNITYSGYQYDEETGLYYLNARMYDPVTARFMQEDTYRGDINDPLSLNLYTYCHNEPMMYWDPSGHSRIGDWWNDTTYKFNKFTDEAAYKVNKASDVVADKTKEIVHANVEVAKTLWNNPAEVVNAVDQLYIDPTAKAILGEDSLAYKTNKYVRTRQEGLTVTALNLGKGIVQTGYNTIGKGVGYSFQSTGNMVGNAVGIVDDETFRQRDIAINNKIDVWSEQMKELPSNMWNGLKNDFGTTFNKENTWNYITNYDASLHDIVEYQQSTVNLAITAYGGATVAKAGFSSIRNGLNRVVTPEPVFAAEQSASRLALKVEANAQRQLIKMESLTPNAHYVARHGAQTTLEQQYISATKGLRPNGVQMNPVDSSRFLSNQTQLNAIQRAQTIYKQTGRNSFDFNTGETIGEGFIKGGGDLIRTTNVQAIFRNGELYTLYPKLSPIK